MKNSDAVLIDRGDLSRYIPVFKIPVQQLKILKLYQNRLKFVDVAFMTKLEELKLSSNFLEYSDV